MRDPLLAAFGARVRAARTAKNWSQEHFADRCGLHRTYIGAIERGERNVSLQNIAIIAAALGISPAFLVDHLPQPRPRGEE